MSDRFPHIWFLNTLINSTTARYTGPVTAKQVRIITRALQLVWAVCADVLCLVFSKYVAVLLPNISTFVESLSIGKPSKQTTHFLYFSNCNVMNCNILIEACRIWFVDDQLISSTWLVLTLLIPMEAGGVYLSFYMTVHGRDNHLRFSIHLTSLISSWPRVTQISPAASGTWNTLITGCK